MSKPRLKLQLSLPLINSFEEAIIELNQQPGFDFSYAKDVSGDEATLTIEANDVEQFIKLGFHQAPKLRELLFLKK